MFSIPFILRHSFIATMQEPEPDHLFKGVYIGDEPLAEFLKEVDPNLQLFPCVCEYIWAFPFTKEYFNRVYPFYSGSKVSEGTIHTIYESSFITFVQMFKLNHPDWSDYSNDDCLQHFINFIELNPDPNTISNMINKTMRFTHFITAN